MSLYAESQIQRLFLNRIRILLYLLVVLFLIFLWRIASWTLFHQSYYQELAKSNFIHPQRLDAPRGKIYSRDGHSLAVNRATYSISLSPFGIEKSELHNTIKYLEGVLGTDFSQKEEEAYQLRPRWQRILLVRNLSLETIAPILEREWDLPGLRISSDFKRYYPAGSLTAHISGYLGFIPPDKLKNYLDKGYERDDLVGMAGIEYTYEELLAGIPGQEIVQRDARGRYCATLETEPSVPGEDLHLTLDLDFQKYAEAKIGSRNGVILVTNPENGDVFVMVSAPSYDSNNPAATAASIEPVSFLNKAIQENYLPASTFKLVTAMGGLASGLRPKSKFICEGYYYLPQWKRPFKCDTLSGHGDIDLYEAIKYSCNIYFYQSVQTMGAARLLEWALHSGYGARTGIDLPFEVPGYLPIQSADSMLPGDLLNLSIGQGHISSTPLQVLQSYCIFANVGRIVPPHLLKYFVDAEGKRKDFIPGTWQVPMRFEDHQAVLKGLINVVNAPGGTACHAGFSPEWKVAGKTGTAERKDKNDAWFVCFAPYDSPEVVVLVFIEEGGGGGSVAAPVAKDILDYYFLNRSRLRD
jgi:penicillin-binding protein 2